MLRTICENILVTLQTALCRRFRHPDDHAHSKETARDAEAPNVQRRAGRGGKRRVTHRAEGTVGDT